MAAGIPVPACPMARHCARIPIRLKQADAALASPPRLCSLHAPRFVTAGIASCIGMAGRPLCSQDDPRSVTMTQRGP
jgi:hypothetical protein